MSVSEGGTQKVWNKYGLFTVNSISKLDELLIKLNV
jgi:hypothetical protein